MYFLHSTLFTERMRTGKYWGYPESIPPDGEIVLPLATSFCKKIRAVKIMILILARHQVHADYAGGAGVFDLTTKEVLYSQNLFGKLYPASTTKILTAYIIIRNCDLDDKVTVSADAIANMADSSKCGLAAGDVLTVRDLLYGLLLVSGNDAANVLAEYYSGSIDKFAEEMNREAKALGATQSHFVNANGLPDEDHYTTVYDMYLIFQEAIQTQDFIDIIHTKSYDAAYQNASGNTVTQTWESTNRYLNGQTTEPEDITVIGGKTGTTNATGYVCFVFKKA